MPSASALMPASPTVRSQPSTVINHNSLFQTHVLDSSKSLNNLCLVFSLLHLVAGTVEILWASIYVAIGGMGAWTLWYRNLYYGLRYVGTAF
jgi:hypothetical protein